ncbi:hypothetical protein [Burkholderia diffusa]|uniref:hypothetical protein n=1 Tax=Burkholderia diffusa TaxID=488732 RepID=UPI0014791ED3|nr:hypothetical protein [Burkholderia diffusa]MBM2650947.1 hypothetical protein [Burkholderia diffusa]
MFSALRRVRTPADNAGIDSFTSIVTIRLRIQSISMKCFGPHDTMSVHRDSANAALNDVHSTIDCAVISSRNARDRRADTDCPRAARRHAARRFRGRAEA